MPISCKLNLKFKIADAIPTRREEKRNQMVNPTNIFKSHEDIKENDLFEDSRPNKFVGVDIRKKNLEVILKKRTKKKSVRRENNISSSVGVTNAAIDVEFVLNNISIKSASQGMTRKKRKIKSHLLNFIV